MTSITTQMCSMSIEDAGHYINSEVNNIINTGELTISNLSDVPYELLDAEYLLFENTAESDKDKKVIKVSDVDKILLCIIDKYQNGTDIKAIKIDKAYILLIKQIIDVNKKK